MLQGHWTGRIHILHSHSLLAKFMSIMVFPASFINIHLIAAMLMVISSSYGVQRQPWLHSVTANIGALQDLPWGDVGEWGREFPRSVSPLPTLWKEVHYRGNWSHPSPLMDLPHPTTTSQGTNCSSISSSATSRGSTNASLHHITGGPFLLHQRPSTVLHSSNSNWLIRRQLSCGVA